MGAVHLHALRSGTTVGWRRQWKGNRASAFPREGRDKERLANCRGTDGQPAARGNLLGNRNILWIAVVVARL